MGKNFQANYSLFLEEENLSKLKLLSQTSGVSMAKIINNLVTDYVEKFSAEIAELKHATQIAANKVKEKIFGENVKKIFLKKIPTNNGARLAAVLNDQITVAIKIEKVDEEKAMVFIQKAMSTIGSGSHSYEITRRDEKSIVITADDETLSQKFDDAGTAEKVEAFIDEIFAQLTKQAFQNQGN